MSGGGGGKVSTRAFWDPNTMQEVVGSFSTTTDMFRDMAATIADLQKRIEQLETAYMELKMLGSDPGKIEQ